MVDFRYHVVSLVAVFLALGIGIVFGTTVIDRALLDNLDSNVERLTAEKRGSRTTPRPRRAHRRRGGVGRGGRAGARSRRSLR